jgi:divalent metal cation (Fe/Co/Zn/Cd) transporter
VTEVRRIRLRRAGNKLFTDVIIAAPRTYTFEQIHELSEDVEKAARDGLHNVSPQGEVDVVVHVEPTASPQETVTDQIHYLAELQGVHAHDIHVRDVNGRLEADFDVEVQSDMNLQDAHAVATRLEQAVLDGNERLRRVTTHLEAPNEVVVPRQEVTQNYQDMKNTICTIADGVAGKGSAHDIHLYRSQPTLVSANGTHATTDHIENKLDLVLHTTFDAQVPLSQAHIQAEEIKRRLRHEYPHLDSVVIHTEPPEA